MNSIEPPCTSKLRSSRLGRRLARGLAFGLLALVAPCLAGEPRSFYGTWVPPASLQPFWSPISDSWWQKGATPKLTRRCRDFAEHHNPREVIPEMIADLRAHPSEVRWFVYLHIMQSWPKARVLAVLRPFLRSSDEEIKHLAHEFYADIE